MLLQEVESHALLKLRVSLWLMCGPTKIVVFTGLRAKEGLVDRWFLGAG